MYGVWGLRNKGWYVFREMKHFETSSHNVCKEDSVSNFFARNLAGHLGEFVTQTIILLKCTIDLTADVHE